MFTNKPRTPSFRLYDLIKKEKQLRRCKGSCNNMRQSRTKDIRHLRSKNQFVMIKYLDTKVPLFLPYSLRNKTKTKTYMKILKNILVPTPIPVVVTQANVPHIYQNCGVRIASLIGTSKKKF